MGARKTGLSAAPHSACLGGAACYASHARSRVWRLTQMKIRSLAALALAPLVSLAAVGAASAEDLVFMLDNQTKTDVREFYTSPVDVNNWEQDVLGQDVLGAGSATKVTIGDGRSVCNYDMKFVFSDDTTLEKDGVNLCDTGSYTLTDE
jgi:hypothetical protein